MCSKSQGYYQDSNDITLVKRENGWYFMIAGYVSEVGYETTIEAKLQAEVYIILRDTE